MSATIVDVIENCLDIPLTRPELSKFKLTSTHLSQLAEAVDIFYASYSLPDKGNAFRPSISAGFTTSQGLGLSYVSGPANFSSAGSYEFSEQTAGKMTTELKRFLLYCDSVVIEDPLPYLLDYFRTHSDSKITSARMPAVKALLEEYSDLSQLLRANIVLPVQGHVVELSKVKYAEEPILKIVQDALPKMSYRDIDALAAKISEEQYRNFKLGNQADLFFPDSSYVTVLKQILIAQKKQFTSRDLTRPYGVSILGRLSSIDANSLAASDLVQIRLNEKLFNDWRTFLSKIFQDLSSKQDEFSDLDNEFQISQREEFAQWQQRFSQEIEKGSISKFLRKSPSSITIGSVAGAIGGYATGAADAAILGAFLGSATGAIKPTIEAITAGVEAGSKRKNAKTLTNHFIALGFTEEEIN